MQDDNSLDHLNHIINDWIESKKIGSIQINFFKGGIANIIKNESEKLNKNFHNPKNEVEKNGSFKVETQWNHSVNNA